MIRSLKILVVFLLCGNFLIAFFRPITSINEDLGRHLLLGQIIVAEGSVPTINLLSYAYSDFPFVNSHWLSEVVYAVAYAVGGFHALLLLAVATIGVAVLVLIRHVATRYSFNAILFGAVLYLFLLIQRSDVRPELFSMLFTAIFVTVLFANREQVSRKLLLLIPLALLWVNFHIYFFVGPVLVGLFFLECLIRDGFAVTRSLKWYGITFLGVLFVSLVNPNELEGALFPFLVHGNYGLPIFENGNMFYLHGRFLYSGITLYVIAVVVLFFLLFRAGRRARSIDWLLALSFSLAGFLIYRNIQLFAIVTFIPFVHAADLFIRDTMSLRSKLLPTRYARALTVYALSMTSLVLLLFGAKSYVANGFGFGVVENWKGAVDFLVEHKVSGHVFNKFDMGGYLAYRLYPTPVYLDNRPEAYPASYFQKIYEPMHEDLSLFDKEDQRYHFTALILPRGTQFPELDTFSDRLLSHPNFSLVYVDKRTYILMRNTEENSAFIKKYKIALPTDSR